ncbi:MAG: sporulation protein YabP [Syntrophomonas sp.]|nr:sporulation protein YabP [Syntrophomonas sp.]
MAEHSLNLANRQRLALTGVNNVISFDEQEIILSTNLGYLSVAGEELHINALNLDEGKVAIQGNVNNIGYKPQGTDLKAKGKNMLGRLFK